MAEVIVLPAALTPQAKSRLTSRIGLKHSSRDEGTLTQIACTSFERMSEECLIFAGTMERFAPEVASSMLAGMKLFQDSYLKLTAMVEDMTDSDGTGT